MNKEISQDKYFEVMERALGISRRKIEEGAYIYDEEIKVHYFSLGGLEFATFWSEEEDEFIITRISLGIQLIFAVAYSTETLTRSNQKEMELLKGICTKAFPSQYLIEMASEKSEMEQDRIRNYYKDKLRESQMMLDLCQKELYSLKKDDLEEVE